MRVVAEVEIDVIDPDERSRPEPRLEEREDRQSQFRPAVEQYEIDRSGDVGQRVAGVADAKVDHVAETGGIEIALGRSGFVGLQLCPDDSSAAVVTDRADEWWSVRPIRRAGSS